MLLLCGCKSPKFNYPQPSSKIIDTGPTIQVMAIVDNRTNRAMDKVLEKGYLLDVQRAMADELQSMNLFSAVIVTTNSAESTPSDYKLTSRLKRLEWEIPHYGTLETEAFTIGLLTGVVGGSIFAATGIDVFGYSVVTVRVEKTSDSQVLFDSEYSASVTNHLKKAVCDTPTTKASMMVQAFQRSMMSVKADLQQKMPASFTRPSAPDSSVSSRTDTNSALTIPEK